MAVPLAPTEIVNLALDIIKTENINDVAIPAGEKISEVANRWYDAIRQSALEGFPWNFASTRKNIPLDAETPKFGWNDSYKLPSNFLSLNFIKDQAIPLSQWNYVIEGRNIFIDNEGKESLPIGYIYDMTDVTKFSPSFKMYLAALVAENIAYKLTGNRGLQASVVQRRQTEQLNAQSKNGKGNPPIAFRQSRMLNARRIYGGASRLGRPYGRN